MPKDEQRAGQKSWLEEHKQAQNEKLLYKNSQAFRMITFLFYSPNNIKLFGKGAGNAFS